MPLIALATDYGWESGYVGMLKGALLAVEPSLNLVDITHQLPLFDPLAAHTHLRQAFFGFPLGSVLLIDMDGANRELKRILCQSRGLSYIGPDNGVLTRILAQPETEIFEIPDAQESSFPARHRLASIASELALGVDAFALGLRPYQPTNTQSEPIFIQHHEAEYLPEHKHYRGRILSADRFGNLATNLPATCVEIRIAGRSLKSTRVTQPNKKLYAFVGDDGYVWLARWQHSAMSTLSQELKGSPLGLELVGTQDGNGTDN